MLVSEQQQVLKPQLELTQMRKIFIPTCLYLFDWIIEV
jgi:hypothetical protein